MTTESFASEGFLFFGERDRQQARGLLWISRIFPAVFEVERVIIERPEQAGAVVLERSAPG